MACWSGDQIQANKVILHYFLVRFNCSGWVVVGADQQGQNTDFYYEIDININTELKQ
jgi:hypothetical protein